MITRTVMAGLIASLAFAFGTFDSALAVTGPFPDQAYNSYPKAQKKKAYSKSYSSSKKQAFKSSSRKQRVARSMWSAPASGGGASRACLQAPARALLDQIEQKFGAVSVISTCRPGAVIAGSGKPSKHRYGLAVDFDAGARKGQIVQWLIANHHAGGTMTYRNMSHIHIDIGARFVSLGSGSRG